jgi:hypothetical protein
MSGIQSYQRFAWVHLEDFNRNSWRDWPLSTAIIVDAHEAYE